MGHNIDYQTLLLCIMRTRQKLIGYNSPTLTIYFLRETIPFQLLALVVLTSVIYIQQLIRQADSLSVEAPVISTLHIMYYILPGVLVITIPLATLLGTLLAINRLESDLEITSARSCGVSSKELALPFIGTALIAATLTGWLTLKVVPSSLQELRTLKTQALKHLLELRVRPQTLSTAFNNHLIFVKDIDPTSGDWIGVFVLKQATPEETQVLNAERGQLRIIPSEGDAVSIRLINGTAVTITEGLQHPKTVGVFSRHDTKLTGESVQPENTANPLRRTVQESSTEELTARLRNTPPNPQEQRQTLVEWHKRIALPLGAVLLTLTAIPMGLRMSGTLSRTSMLSIGFGLAVIYYLILIAGQNLALAGSLHPIIGVWMANLIFVGTAITISTSPPLPKIWRRSAPHPHKPEKQETGAGKQKSDSYFHNWKILDICNYLLLSEVVKFTLFSCGILVIATLVFTLFDIVPSVARNKIQAGFVASYLWYLSPQITYFTAPFGLLLGLLATFSILSRSNQLTALSAHGQSNYQLTLPALAGALIASISLFLMAETILPQSNREQDSRYNSIKGRKGEQAIQAFGYRWVYGANQMIFQYQHINDNNQLLKATAYKFNSAPHRLCQIIHADKAEQTGPDVWTAIDGGWEDNLCEREPEAGHQDRATPLEQSSAGSITLRVDEGPAIFRRTVNESAKMSLKELRTYIRQISRAGDRATTLRIDYEKKKAFPLSCIILTILTLPYCLTLTRRNTINKVSLSIGLSLAFWAVVSILETFGKQELLPVWLAAWGGQAAFCAVGMYLFFRAAR
ncbi:MAG TPA: LptF/LptG family permease [Blastocatellia bacterium]|nr:LptF/LptG family permease [Blastocatellia bacterium]